MQRYQLFYSVEPPSAHMKPWMNGEYVLHSEAQARIEALESELTASAARVTELEDALRATVAYMKEDSVGYEVYRATLDAAEAALSIKVGETKDARD